VLRQYVIALIGTSLIGVAAVTATQTAGANSLEQQSSVVKDVTYALARLPENPKQYSLILSDSEERSVSGVFSIDQLQVLKAIMIEAEKFALSNEAVGTKEPVVTRFADKQEQAFVVDVEKLGNQSRIFVTLSTEIGRMTADAGSINRSIKREDGFFFDLLSRLQAELPKLPAQSSK